MRARYRLQTEGIHTILTSLASAWRSLVAPCKKTSCEKSVQSLIPLIFLNSIHNIT